MRATWWRRIRPTVVALLALGWSACWVAVLLDDPEAGSDSLVTTLGLMGLLCALLIGASTPLPAACLIGAVVTVVLVVAPTPTDPDLVAVEEAGGCDPFCDTGGSLIGAFSRFAALALPLAPTPVFAGASVRAGDLDLRRRNTV